MGTGHKIIDLAHWARREHYEFFRAFGYPFFSITTPIDVMPLHKALKERGVSFSIGLVYVLARAANAVPQFRQRIRDEGPIEHEVVHPGLTILCEGNTFRFSFLPYSPAFDRFAKEAAEAIEMTRRSEGLIPRSIAERSSINDMLYMTSLPWFSFTGMVHPMSLDPSDSVPRIAWGRFENRDKKLVMALNVQAHHSLIDGFHIAEFIKKVEGLIATLDSTL